MRKGLFRTSDDASLYYEITGKGQPLVLVHGWACSNKFWQRNVPALSKKFKVVTFDLRGHGQSSKGIHGITIRRMATDVHELIEYLKLRNVILMGWSMGGPIVLSYWKMFKNNSHLAGMGLIDMTPYPFSDGEWNTHSFKNFNTEGLNKFHQGMLGNHKAFARSFIPNMYPDRKIPAGTEWVEEEILKQPADVGVAAYSDYCYSDFTDVLPTVTVPTLVFSGNSGIFKDSEKQGAWEAAQMPDAEQVVFKKGGHMLFYLEAEKFNQAVIDRFYQKAE